MEQIIKPYVTKNKLREIIAQRNWMEYFTVIDHEAVETLDMKSLKSKIRKLEQEKSVGEGFESVVQEIRRRKKARVASKKHKNKTERDEADLNIEIYKRKKIVQDLRAEKESLQNEINYYRNGNLSHLADPLYQACQTGGPQVAQRWPASQLRKNIKIE